jgi:hypothetical protein
MAKFNFIDLDEEIRGFILSEIEYDGDRDKLFLSTRLNDLGIEKYKNYLIQSATSGDEEIFENLLDISTHFNPTYLRIGKPVKMPTNASTLLCQSEFNRYYVRALCRKAINDKIENLEIYRARESSFKRPESELKIGTLLSVAELLEDLRSSIGEEPKLFPDINSGLCVKFQQN